MVEAAKQKPCCSEETLGPQLKRLRVFNGYAEIKIELMRVFQRFAVDGAHAERIIDSILEKRRPNEKGFASCPVPSEFRDYCEDVPVIDPWFQEPAKSCGDCRGTGWRYGFRMVDGLRVEGVERCGCTRKQ